ncbi:hypothetical protein [Prosthecobacter sp.]|uniref:hypothetical protein n=1 Tax=Prosthecobacter sp. TaxID=1965333 RepID=UPI003782D657
MEKREDTIEQLKRLLEEPGLSNEEREEIVDNIRQLAFSIVNADWLDEQFLKKSCQAFRRA